MRQPHLPLPQCQSRLSQAPGPFREFFEASATVSGYPMAPGALARPLATCEPSQCNLIGKTNGWKHIVNALTIHCGDRIAANHQ